jgi:hypothetical protein
MEHVILFATDLGLGTCWLGGTFSKSGFAKKIAMRAREVMPAVAVIGYVAEESWFGGWIRKRAGSDVRFPWESLFFDEKFFFEDGAKTLLLNAKNRETLHVALNVLEASPEITSDTLPSLLSQLEEKAGRKGKNLQN